MTEAWAISLLRSLLIAGLCLYPAKALAKNARILTGLQKGLFITAVLFPLTIPPLLPAYSYSAFEFNFQTSPFLNEVLYCLIISLKALPVIFLIYYIIPPPLSYSALHCNRLLENSRPLRFINRRGVDLLAFSVGLLLVFTEYEIASLMRTTHWTIVIFNAHAGGLIQSPANSLRLAALPILSSLVIVLGGLQVLKYLNSAKGQHQVKGPANKTICTLIISISMLLLLIYPAGRILAGSTGGFKYVFQGQWMKSELLNSFLFTVVATCCCWYISGWLKKSIKRPALISFLLLPGLSGGLILGLAFVYMFNIQGLDNLKQSAIPLTLALIAYGLPVATLMQVFKHEERIDSSLQAVTLLPAKNQKPLIWLFQTLPNLLFTIPVFCIIWFDLTLSSMLAPAAMPGIFPRLYNLMHYNENERLSATVFLIIFIPFLFFGTLILLSRLKAHFRS
jgi:hypothetical protein